MHKNNNMNIKIKKMYLIFIGIIFIFHLYGSAYLNPSILLDKHQSEEKEIRAEFQFSIGTDKDNEDFYKPNYFTVDQEGNIYILDTGNSRIQCFSSEGKFLSSFGQLGQGPGELSRDASKLKVLDDGNLYLIDNYQRRITVYSKNGEYQKSYNTHSPYDDIVLWNKTYYLSNIILREKHKVIYITQNLNEVKKSIGHLIEPTPDIIKMVKSSPIPPLLENEFAYMNMTNIIVNSNGEIIYSQRQPYHLMKYSKNGRKIKEIIGNVNFDTHFPLKISFDGSIVRKKVVSPVSNVFESILLEDDQFIVPIINPERSFIYLDFYNSDCLLISRYKLPNIFFNKTKKEGITNIFIDRNNSFYCLINSMEAIPKLLKYKLIFN
ncbi:MAG: hypothetical protein JXC36_06685 [Candidatus Atribacteria bacterium]|nr:hypothetical protein [Candidatus Atribacteria bacterium]